ncbi:hypothetical protein Hanom_Chr04g00286981 [Helianthus anomalus]
MHLVPSQTNSKVLACLSYRLNALQSANHKDHPCTFGKLGTNQNFGKLQRPSVYFTLRPYVMGLYKGMKDFDNALTPLLMGIIGA